jgi:hypothetical protein
MIDDMYPTVTAQQYAADRFPIKSRAVTTEQAEERGLFLARKGAMLGAYSPAWHEVVRRLAQSSNAAIANEARRLQDARKEAGL